MPRPAWVPAPQASEISGGLITTNILPPHRGEPEDVQVDIQTLYDGILRLGGFQSFVGASDGDLGYSYNQDEPAKGLNVRDVRNATLNIGLGQPDQRDSFYLDRIDRTLRSQAVRAVLRHNLVGGVSMEPYTRYVSNVLLSTDYGLMSLSLLADLDVPYQATGLVAGAILGGNWAVQAAVHGAENLLPDAFLGFRPTRAALAAKTLVRPLVRPTPLKNYR